MKQEDYVTFDVAKLLKEKGYDESSKYYYRKNDNNFTYTAFAVRNSIETLYISECTAHPLAEIAKWLREQHNIAVCVHPYDYSWDYTLFNLLKIDDDYNHVFIISNGFYKTYEEALNEGIKEALNYI